MAVDLGRYPSRSVGITFGEAAVLVQQEAGSRNVHGEFVPGPTRSTPLMCASAPVSVNEFTAIAADLPEGLRLEDARTFWLAREDARSIRVASKDTTQGDVLLYEGTYYRLSKRKEWGSIQEVLGVREEQLNV